MTTTIFSFNSTEFYPILAYAQVDKDALTSMDQLVPTFYRFDYGNSRWQAEPKLAINAPTKRSGASLVLTSKNDIYLFGGFIVDPNSALCLLTRQMYHYSFQKKIWKDLTKSTSSSKIPPSAFHTATLINDEFIVYLGGAVLVSNQKDGEIGGLTTMESSIKRNLTLAYVYDLKKSEWRIKETINPSLLPRIAHTATYIPKLRSIAVLGGTDQATAGGKLYNDLQLLNIDTWTWSQPDLTLLYNDSFDDLDNSLILGRAWHSTQLVGDQLLISNGDAVCPNNISCSFFALNIDNWTYTDQVQKAPELSDNYPLSLTEGLTNSIRNDSDRFNNQLILGISLGILAGAITTGLIGLIVWKYRKRKNKTDKDLELLKRISLFLTPLWSDTLIKSNTKLWDLDLPLTSNSINDKTWELDSQYAYSPRISLRSPSYYLHKNYLNDKDLYKESKKEGVGRRLNLELTHTFIGTRRWSIPSTNVKLFKESTCLELSTNEHFTLISTSSEDEKNK